MYEPSRLLARWRAHFPLGHGGSERGDDCDAVFHDLVARYGEAHRAYHTFAHVESLLALLDGERVPEREAVELAVWFHDAVYDPARSDNEERSAALAAGALTGLAVPEALVERVRSLILVTKHHDAGADDAAAVLVDADLSVLGADQAAYDAYARAIRVEYAWVPEAAYRAGRARVLASFLARDGIYVTAAFRERFEARARVNLARERQKLESGAHR